MKYISFDNTDDEIELKPIALGNNPWLVACSLFFIFILFLSSKLVHDFSKPDNSNRPVDVAIAKQTGFQHPLLTASDADSKIPSAAKVVTVTINAKDNLGKIFKNAGLSTATAMEIVGLKGAKILKGMIPGKKLTLVVDHDAKLHELKYEIDAIDTLVITPKDNGWNVETRHIEPEVKVRYATSKVNKSIYAAAKEIGVPVGLINQIMNLYSQQLNVNRIRSTDRFTVFYKDFILDGKKVKNSQLTAAELIHNNKPYRIIRFVDPDGHVDYFTPEGRSLKPAFERFPIVFKQITSKFSLKRKHPILPITRPHYGVDLSASRGTPIKATSKGVIKAAGYEGGYGRVIRLENGKYSTVYAHLAGFAQGIKPGKYVNQGDIIGYVGSSGLSTSPHLHYEFRVNGVARDPLTVELPTSGTVAVKYRKQFLAKAEKILEQLESYRDNHKVLAMMEKTKFE